MEEKMKILVTGKNGFLARNAIEFFGSRGHLVEGISHTADDTELLFACKDCDFVFHFAAVQRADNVNDFYTGNVEYTKRLINSLKKVNSEANIIFSTSTAIDQESVFSSTKKEAERLLRDYAKEKKVHLFVFKLNHIFGKYAKPNFNSVIATFCYNIANQLPITVVDPSVQLKLTYIDDLMQDFNNIIKGNKNLEEEYYYPTKWEVVSLGELVRIIGDCKKGVVETVLEKQMYSTYKYFRG